MERGVAMSAGLSGNRPTCPITGACSCSVPQSERKVQPVYICVCVLLVVFLLQKCTYMYFLSLFRYIYCLSHHAPKVTQLSTFDL